MPEFAQDKKSGSSHNVKDEAGVMEPEAPPPMPGLAELTQQLELVLNDLNLHSVTQATIRRMPAERQWDMVLAHGQSTQQKVESTSVEDHIASLKEYMEVIPLRAFANHLT